MDGLQDIIERIKRLPAAEQRHLVDVIERGLPAKEAETETSEEKETRLAAMRRFMARAGTVHTEFTDVSSNKYKHLADIYADDHGPADRK